MNVLVVDKNAGDREKLRLSLERHGCTVIEAADGLEGLGCAIHHQPDLVVSNTLISRMDGFQLLWALKSDPKLTSIPFLFYSDTYAGRQETKLALSIGAEAFIVKRGDPEEVWESASKILLSGKVREEAHACPDTEKNARKHLWEYSRINAIKLEEKTRELEEAMIQHEKDAEELRALNAELTRKIAECKRAEETIKEKEQERTAIFDVAPFIILFLDREQTIRRVNSAACSFSGTPVASMISRRGGDVLRCLHALKSPEGCGANPHCRQCALRINIKHTFETGQSRHGQEVSLPLSSIHHDRVTTFLMSTTKVTIGHQDMVVLAIQDITRQKEVEKRLRLARRRELLSFLAGGIAREIHTMLAKIAEHGNRTLTNMRIDDPQRQNIEQILGITGKAAHLTDGLFIHAKTKTTNKKRIDLNDTLTSMKSPLKRILGRNIACTIERPGDALPVFADEHQLGRIMMHLAANARCAMPKGGSFTISTDRASIDDAFIASHGFGCPGSYALLSAKDTGMGMDTLTQQYLFDPFYNMKSNRTWPEPGMSVVSGILQQHNSFINVISEPGRGTTIQIYIPLFTAGTEDETQKPEVRLPKTGKATILLAEDDESVRNMAMALLQHSGYEVIPAVDGADAIMKYKEHAKKIQLLLFDLVMPKKTGNEASNEIRKLKPNIKIIFTTGSLQEADKRNIAADKNATLIFKPYLPTFFLQKVRNMLDGAAP